METAKYPTIWTNRVEPFALAVGKSIEEVTAKLTPVVGDPATEVGATEAIALLDNPEATPDADIKAALKDLSIPSGKMNAHISKLRPEKTEVPTTPGNPGVSATGFSILPALPDDKSFLEMLKTGGVLKVSQTEVISAIKAALAKTVGLFELPDKIYQKMEDFAIKQEEPCGENFYRIQKLLTQRSYGEVLSVLGVTGQFVSEKRKKDFFIKVDERLWTSLGDFNNSLTKWHKSWTDTAVNPAALMIMMAGGQSGQPLPNMIAPPDTLPIRTAGEEVINDINKIFAGTGIPIARALAYDATRIMGILEDKDLPLQTGAANKDQMLKELGISVGAGIVQIEQNLGRYALSIMKLPEITADSELMYFTAMLTLGASIPWDKLGSKGLGSKDLRK